MTQIHPNAIPIDIKKENPPAWIMDGCMSIGRVDVAHTVWTYDGAIYNPGGAELADNVIAHEATHIRQQRDIEGGADAWWKQFLTDPEFRLEQEMQAYGVQYAYFCGLVRDRERQARFLHQLASILSGPLYQTAITHGDAKKGIKACAPNFSR